MARACRWRAIATITGRGHEDQQTTEGRTWNGETRRGPGHMNAAASSAAFDRRATRDTTVTRGSRRSVPVVAGVAARLSGTDRPRPAGDHAGEISTGASIAVDNFSWISGLRQPPFDPRMRPSELRASHRRTSCDAPDSTRPRIGSGVSAAHVCRNAERCHRGTPRPILSRCLPKTRRLNRRAAGPDPEPRSPALPRPRETRPVGVSRGAESQGVTADLGPLSERTARPDVRRHACPPATGGVCPLHPLSPAVA